LWRQGDAERVFHTHEELAEREAVEPEIAVERAVEGRGRRALAGAALGNEVADESDQHDLVVEPGRRHSAGSA
jgi:hypothetical protein